MVSCFLFGRGGGDALGNTPSSSNLSIRAFRAQIYQFELFELIFLVKLDKQFPVEQFKASRAIRGNSISVNSIIPPSQRPTRCPTWRTTSSRSMPRTPSATCRRRCRRRQSIRPLIQQNKWTAHQKKQEPGIDNIKIKGFTWSYSLGKRRRWCTSTTRAPPARAAGCIGAITDGSGTPDPNPPEI